MLFSCTEDTQVNMVTGRLFNDCNNTLGSAEIALKANVGVDFGDPIILGSGIANGQGSFSFTYELEEDDKGTGNLILITNQGFETLISSVTLNTNLNLTLYRENKSTVYVDLEGSKTFAATDTLFYGLEISSEEKFTVQPANGRLDSLSGVVPNMTSGSTSTNLYYGVGSAQFKLAKEALSIADSSFNHLKLNLLGCVESDTSTLTIN